jgi:MFS family permease
MRPGCAQKHVSGWHGVGNERAAGNSTMNGKRLLAFGLFLTVTIAAFEVTAVITALPTIVDELDGSSLYGATIAANLLASIVAIVASGEYADRIGPAKPYAFAATIFVAGLIVSGLANTMPLVVLGRVLQGLGAGGFSTLPYVAIRRSFPEPQQPKMYAVLSAGWVLPSLIAPLVAGWLTEEFGWRWVFLSMIPLAVVVSVAVVVQLQQLPPIEPEAPAGDEPGDVATAHQPADPAAASRIPQALRLSGGAGLVLAGLPQAQLWIGLPLVIVGAAITVRPWQALWPAGWVRARPGLAAAVAARFCATAAFAAVDGFVPLAADRVHGVGATAQGFVIIGAALTWTLGQVFAAKVAGTIPTQRLVKVGFGILALGAVLVVPVISDDTPLWATFVAWSVGGLGMGLLFNPTTVVALSSVSEAESGRASSQLSIADALGFASTSAVGGALVAASERGNFSIETALAMTFGLTVVIAVVGFAAAPGVRRPDPLAVAANPRSAS